MSIYFTRIPKYFITVMNEEIAKKILKMLRSNGNPRYLLIDVILATPDYTLGLTGARKRSKQKTTRVVPVKLPKQLINRLDEIAKQLHTSRSMIIKEAILLWLALYENKEEKENS